MLGTTWESFFVEGQKLGFLHRETVQEADSPIVTSTLTIRYGTARFRHRYSFNAAPPYATHSWLFDSNDGAPVDVRIVGDEMICQLDDDVVVEVIPAGARPSYGNYPLLVTRPFKAGYQLSYPRIDDATLTVWGETRLSCVGWESVFIKGEQQRLWRIDEFHSGRSGNQYWLNEAHEICLSKWRGGISIKEASYADVIEGLSAELQHDATLLQTGRGGPNEPSDWLQDIEAWLKQH